MKVSDFRQCCRIGRDCAWRMALGYPAAEAGGSAISRWIWPRQIGGATRTLIRER